jgi:polysaccharide export outer membrane protein
LSGAVVVRNDGKISMPLLNDVPAAGDTPTQLAAVITDRLKHYVSDPHVTVVVTKIDSKKVFLLGEVNHVGPVSMLPDMTVLQALASGGGFSKFANLKKIYILRAENGKQVKIPFNYKDVIGGKMPEQNIVLKAGDTIVVP